MNILNSSEAFAALMAGKNILCRAAGEPMDFDDLNQFPATVFAMSGYEYCIKRDSLSLADILFTKPVEPHDLETGQEIYIVMPTCILRTTYDSEHADIRLSVANGFAQLDEENAKLQLQAFAKTFGNMISEIEVKDGFNDKPKKRSRRTKAEIENSQNSTSNDVEEKSFESQPNIQIIEQGPTAAVEESLIEEIETVDRSKWPVSQIPSQKYIDMWLSRAKDEPTRRNLDLMKASMDHNWDKLDHDHQLQARQICADYEALVEQAEGEAIETDPASEAKTPEQTVQSIKDAEYESLFAELEERARNASSPTEANALYKYTMKWTEEQRKPLMNVINARLLELDQQNKTEPTTPPSLMVQIQNAPDLTALDALEIDVYSRHVDIQPKLMGYVKQRRFELQNQSEVVS
ncbi:hypothetical protein [Acinetobacter chinensis]|uniref:hypothetical protein n=1 Tax=Acinetobacter chinensis TaxID=2004650 RepID=UPI0029344629|nr:hypothetical protein [Acinetobacter chinensis]WOE40745.1 hypothetical protein QSG87_12735 [Acinetobacter chinensis]